MIFKDLFLQAIYSLISHGTHALISILGIAWGIITVIILMTYGDGLNKALDYSMHGAYTDGTVIMWDGQTSKQAGGERAGRRIKLKEKDAFAIKELPSIKYASPEYIETLPIAFGNKSIFMTVRGVSPEYGIMRQEIPAQGRFINDEDVKQHKRVVFLGAFLARKLFRNGPAVGQEVKIKGLPFTVIGVLKVKPQIVTYRGPDNYSAFIPYTTVKQLWHREYIENLIIQTKDTEQHQQTFQQAIGVLANRHRFEPDDDRAISRIDSKESTDALNAVSIGLKVVLIFIGTLTLIVGGVGVMNIMLVSVEDRISEIGIRKALGATRWQILFQFLSEGLIITFIGGLVGIGCSYFIVKYIGSYPFLAALLEDETKQADIQMVISPYVVITATIILILVGLVSGFIPARRAASLDPIESLRHE